MLAAIKLARVEKWSQLFTDGTTKRQISFQNLIIGLMKDDNQLDPVVVSSCIFLEDETSEKQTDGILEKLNLLKIRLRRLREVVEERFPDELRMLPSENNMKTRRILVERIEGTIHEMDCMHHLRNVWLEGVEKALTCHLNVFF